ncbi:MAG: precorrin-6y C5,15-methyltransferase (decarboxylating) subunit CbiE [Proteobacteria bacterium]|nr:precorrin-6y C5,15-methyltransferase (decarboxylating) subunit CbiE [Pseudomonadota bacterium]
MSARPAITVVGIGADGCLSLTSRAMNAVSSAQVLVGGERQLAFFAEFAGQRIVLKDGVLAALREVEELAADNNVCILASGDPLFFGIGSLVMRQFGVQHVDIIPQPSSVQWAFARIGLKWDDAHFLSLHGRRRNEFITRVKAMNKVACLTDEEYSPGRIASLLVEAGDTEWRAWVCEDLGSVEERVRSFELAELAEQSEFRPLNILVLVRSNPDWRAPGMIPYLHEDAFAKRMPKKGLITKREVRMLSLAALRIRPDSVVWDIGAGSGSVSIEAALLAPRGRVYAVEVDAEGVAICRDNIRSHGVDNVTVVEGRAPAALADLESPDAVFVGGSKGSLDAIIETSLDRLAPAGTLVVNAITMENVADAYRGFRSRGFVPEVTLVNISRGVPLARYLRYEALNPVHIISVTTPAASESARPDRGGM